MSVIEASKLTKHYGQVEALNSLNLEVREGEVLGFIGSNGAGKSTTIRILLGLLRKTSGEARVFGKDPWKNAVELHRRISYVPGDVNLWPTLTGGEAIDLFGRLRGDWDRKRRQELLEKFDLDPTKKCRTYSKGNRQKVALVSAFSSKAELFILDEPTSGLDPLMEAVFQKCVAEVKAQGKTVLLSSHILAEIEKLCDRVAIIRDGSIVESGSLDQLRHLTRTFIVVETAQSISGLDRLAGVHDLQLIGNKAQFQVDSSQMGNVLQVLSTFDIQALTSTPPTLEELFMRHYGSGAAAAGAHGGGRK
ncbi:ABC transporter ATP-binding protein [Cohnella sp. CIP 111063]|uniref:ABC transporter ATP-binding protein n=1 Tax=unclassified Cohnella TaxID=2636738 RepID=UPI000B8BEC66|nr:MULTISPECIES: ABC transporter ATP-binding protein [unclassified Cohnella]OXS56973.1 ABC transporter ATP-binding protein [Cohnella sp. CIP 111063]PRX69825.1 ABC-2 type transport system ATP-binding protein [Cohnella sp. SGD-V74]